MEIHDGFIVGVFNYCDRWCETCGLTSRCRLFADKARYDAEHDPTMAALIQAPPLPQEVPPPPPRWLEEIIKEANEAASAPLTDDELAALHPPLPAEHAAVCARAMAYCLWVLDWCQQRGESRENPEDPLSVIEWFGSLNMSKIRRALEGLAEFDGDREFPPDHEGSAKVALIGLDRSIAAWRTLAADGRVEHGVASAASEELDWLRVRLEAAIPYARAFVRPGFDEPEALRQLLTTHAE